MIYWTSIIHEIGNGKDFLQFWLFRQLRIGE
jgi:hypothetical protein